MQLRIPQKNSNLKLISQPCQDPDTFFQWRVHKHNLLRKSKRPLNFITIKQEQQMSLSIESNYKRDKNDQKKQLVDNQTKISLKNVHKLRINLKEPQRQKHFSMDRSKMSNLFQQSSQLIEFPSIYQGLIKMTPIKRKINKITSNIQHSQREVQESIKNLQQLSYQ